MELLFASHNRNKISEVKSIFQELPLKLISLVKLADFTEVEENGNSFQENAFLKANYFYKKYQKPTFADDSGLIVPALNGEPGIHSARYGGEYGNYRQNNLYLLRNMKYIHERKATFITVICYFNEVGQVHYFEGRLDGEIIHEFKGENGFGYDPVFLLPELGLTLAELGEERKNKLSHRFQALNKFANYLKKEVD